MKQMLSLLVGLLATGGVMTVRAQKQDQSLLLNLNTIGASGPAIRATRDFQKREGEGKEEKWYKIKEGFLAEFNQNECGVKDFYDQRGNWRYSLLTYGESRLPENIRRLVRSTYFEYAISWVKQVNSEDSFSYVVHIENEAAWKEVVVRDGEMTVWKAFDKVAPDRAF